MSKKITLKHAVEGRVFTRTTARPYTHVVVAKDNATKQLAKLDSWQESDEVLRKTAEYEWKHRQSILDAGVGGFVYYHRNQGGAYMNRTGKHLQVEQWMVDLANEYHTPSIEAEFEKRRQQQRDEYQRRARLIREQANTPYVASWHQSEALAAKAADSLSKTHDTRVEAINDGNE